MTKHYAFLGSSKLPTLCRIEQKDLPSGDTVAETREDADCAECLQAIARHIDKDSTMPETIRHANRLVTPQGHAFTIRTAGDGLPDEPEGDTIVLETLVQNNLGHKTSRLEISPANLLKLQKIVNSLVEAKS